MNIRLQGLFTLQAPLSHISESISTNTYLVQEPIYQPDGSWTEVFVYSGNALRGMLRDLAASYMLEQIGSPTVSLDAFHLLFAGGRIGGEQVVDVERARLWRRAVPMLALFGGGVGNQILPGKLRVGNSYPLCAEACAVLPARYRERASARTYRGMTFEKSFSRKDDTKDDRLRGALPEARAAAPPAQRSLLGEGTPAPKGKAPKEAAEQMRMTSELVAPGVELATEIDAIDVSEVELGALVSALHRFAKSPYLGGQASRGHGKVALRYEMIDLDAADAAAVAGAADPRPVPFFEVDGDRARLAPPAAEAKQAYDAYLRQAYDALLAAKGHEITRLLGEGAA